MGSWLLSSLIKLTFNTLGIAKTHKIPYSLVFLRYNPGFEKIGSLPS